MTARRLFPLLLLAAPLFAQTVNTASPAGQLPPGEREMARSIFADLINTNTSHSAGSTTEAAEKMAARLREAGYTGIVIDGPNDRRKNLVVRLRGNGSGKRPALFICHLDVVEAPRDQWQTDPFHLTEKDGYFYGRGTQDIKEGDAALVDALIRLKREGFVPDRDYIIALTADEEGGPDNGVDWLIQHRRDLLGDAEFVINPDAGGVYSKQGKVYAMNVEATEKTYADYQLAAAGPGGHSSLPTPDNPIYQLSRALERIQKYRFPVDINPVTRVYIQNRARTEHGELQQQLNALLSGGSAAEAAGDQLSKDPFWNATLRTTCVATIVRAGESPNALPAAATANVNCRILPGHSQREVQETLRKVVADPAVAVRFTSNAGVTTDTAPDAMSPTPPPPLPAVFRPLEQVTDKVWPGTPVLPEMETGASDSIYTMAAGIPSYGINGFEIADDNMRFHARDERLGVESFYTGVQFTYLYMKALSGK